MDWAISKRSPIRWLITLAFVFMLVAIERTSLADTIWLRGQTQPICGRFIDADDVKIVFRYHAKSNRDRRTSGTVDIDRAEIELMIRNIRPDQLSSLSPDDPDSYRLLAEELSSQLQDWEARDLAVRLYLIAATNSTDEKQLSALNGMINLARDEAEREEFKILRFLVSRSGASLPEFNKDKQMAKLTASTRARVLDAVQAIRRGQGSRALQIINQADVQSALTTWEHVCTLSELNRMARANRPPMAGLVKLMEIERQLVLVKQGIRPESNPFFEDASWAGQSAESAIPLTLPRLNSVTEFDPSRSVYFEGQWTTVEQKSKLMK